MMLRHFISKKKFTLSIWITFLDLIYYTGYAVSICDKSAINMNTQEELNVRISVCAVFSLRVNCINGTDHY